MRTSSFPLIVEFLRTWLTSNVEAARVVAKQHQELLMELSEKNKWY